MANFLLGAIAAGSLVAALFFLRFWRQTRDTFFLWFAISFAMEGLGRAALSAFPELSEDNPGFYAMRVVAYGLILFAIWRKNRKPPA
jgi:hypothetical protein